MSKDLNAGETTITPAATDSNPAAPAAPKDGANGNADPAAANTQTAAASRDATPKGDPNVDKPGDSGGKPATEPAAPPSVPENYDLKTQKDSLLTESDVTEVAAQAKALGLSQEQAQKFIESKDAAATQFQQRQQQAYRDQQAQWRKSSETDKEIAGQDGKSYKENIELAHRALAKFADANFKKTLNETGLGNHPELIRTFLRIGKGMGDDKTILDVTQTPPTKDQSRADRLYPTHSKKE